MFGTNQSLTANVNLLGLTTIRIGPNEIFLFLLILLGLIGFIVIVWALRHSY